MTKVIKNSIPNTVTCLNLFSGCIACVMAFEAKYELALLFIALSSIFDFFDGLLARMLNAHSIIGKDLDSLADVVSAILQSLQPLDKDGVGFSLTNVAYDSTHIILFCFRVQRYTIYMT